MGAIMMLQDTQGNVISLCDETCYSAKNLECRCVCGGLNHGRGLVKARETVQAQGHELIRRFIDRERITVATRGKLFGEDQDQISLF